MVKLEWKTEKRIVKDLIPLDYNPRVRTEEKQAKLSGSIEKFNLVETPGSAVHRAWRKGKTTGEYSLDRELFDRATKEHEPVANTLLDERSARKRIDDKILETFGI